MLAAAVIRPRYFVALPHSYSLKPFLPRPLTSHLYTLTSTASLTPITSPKSPFSTTLAAMNHPPVALVLCGKSPMMARNFIEEINGEEYESMCILCHVYPFELFPVQRFLSSLHFCTCSYLFSAVKMRRANCPSRFQTIPPTRSERGEFAPPPEKRKRPYNPCTIIMIPKNQKLKSGNFPQ